MTNQEAIKFLEMENELMQFDPSTGEDSPIENQNQDNKDLFEANKVAIKALAKQMNSIHLIEDGIRATGISDHYCIGMCNGMKWCKSLLDGKEPIYDEDKSDWIPCSERLPEKATEVLCCNDDGIIEVGYLKYKRPHILCCENLPLVVENIIAWQPSPEPYKG